MHFIDENEVSGLDKAGAGAGCGGARRHRRVPARRLARTNDVRNEPREKTPTILPTNTVCDSWDSRIYYGAAGEEGVLAHEID